MKRLRRSEAVNNEHQTDQMKQGISRRWFIEQCGVGMGALALHQLLAQSGYAAQDDNPLAPRQMRYAPKAKRVIYLFTEDRVHVHDLHATLLRLLGFDHEKLTYRFQGRDFRLTDVHGVVVEKMLA
jgi:uncharacterized protein DUF1501